MSFMTHQFSSVCKDCTLPFTVERKSQFGRPSTRCPECQATATKQRQAVDDSNKTLRACEMIRLVNARFSKLGGSRKESLMDALAKQTIDNPNIVPTDLRRALTIGAPRKDKYRKIIPDFANAFYAFCVEKYSVTPSAIFKKRKTKEDLEAAAMRKANCKAHKYCFAPWFGSAVDFLIGNDDNPLPRATDYSYLAYTGTRDRSKRDVLEHFGKFELPSPVMLNHPTNEYRYLVFTTDNEVEF